MDEVERNERLYKLVEKIHEDEELMELLATMAVKDHPSMQKTFEILTQNTPIAEFFGVKKMTQAFFDKKCECINDYYCTDEETDQGEIVKYCNYCKARRK